MDERILTLLPQPGKKGVSISKQDYEAVRQAILDSIRCGGEMTLNDLVDEVSRRLDRSFQGSVTWFVVTVKLDMEARGELERVMRQSPQRVRLVN